MKRSNYVRPLIAALTLAVAGGTVLAQTAQGQGPGQGDGQRHSQSNCDRSSSAHGKGKHDQAKGGHSGKHGKHGQYGNRGMSMQLPDEVLSQLNLTSEQQTLYTQARNATESMKQAMRGARNGKGATDGASGEFNPRAMFERQNERFDQMQAARKSLQQEWLGFWDSLNKEQQSVLQAFVQSRRGPSGMSMQGRG